jgi:hypothetical protein
MVKGSRVFVLGGAFCSTLLLSGAALGEQTISGTWKSWFMVESASRGSVKIGFELAIDAPSGDKVTGKWTMLNGDCRGDYPFAGTFKGNKLRIKTDGTGKRGCGPYTGAFDLAGEKMTGRYSGQNITLEK